MARRPRVQGFARGDFDPAFPLDDKVQALRASTDPLRYHAAMSVYWHVVAASWRRPDARVPAIKTCPEAPDQVDDLIRVGLLDKGGRLPVPSFNGWIGRAIASRTSSTERKRRNRTGASRVTDEGQTVTARGTREGVREGNLSDTTKEEETTEGGPGGTTRFAPDSEDRDSLDTYHELTLYRPWGEFSGEKLRVAIRDFGDTAVDAALHEEHRADPDRTTLLNRTLARLARGAERQRRKKPATPKPEPIDLNRRAEILRGITGGATG